jgi:hypothetical protein
MKNLYSDNELLQKNRASMGGVFTISDLRILFGEENGVLLHRRIRTLIKHGSLRLFRRGIYVTNGYDLEQLVIRMYPDATISLTNVLANALVVNTIPTKAVFATRIGPAHTIKGPDATVKLYRIAPEMIFGTDIRNGISYASPEKAFLDTLYYYQKGERYPFNIRTDMNVNRLKLSLMKQFLKKYKNPKFVAFVNGVLEGYGKKA